jgi:type VI secretion system protein ImpH
MAAARRGTATALSTDPAASRGPTGGDRADLAAGPPPDGSAAGLLTYPRGSLAARLMSEGFAFSFFQAVRVLEKLEPGRQAVGRDGPPLAEAVRFKAHLSLAFPPSQIHEVVPPTEGLSVPAMTVSFLGLTGPSGILPRHYTEMLLRLHRDAKGPERYALREFFDLFNHRYISHFYRAWEKYRFYIPYERRAYARPEPDLFTQVFYALVGLGTSGLRGRLRVARLELRGQEVQERPLGRIADLGFIFYSGLLAQRHRTAVGLEGFLEDYFQLPVHVRQFQGHWLPLSLDNQSRLTEAQGNTDLGLNVVAGERVWEVESRIRIRLGPLGFADFTSFLPDRSATTERKALFLLHHLVRLYVGAERSFDVQLILRAEDVPECHLIEEEDAFGPRLGWNTWVCSQEAVQDAGEAIFEGEEVVWLNQL